MISQSKRARVQLLIAPRIRMCIVNNGGNAHVSVTSHREIQCRKLLGSAHSHMFQTRISFLPLWTVQDQHRQGSL